MFRRFLSLVAFILLVSTGSPEGTRLAFDLLSGPGSSQMEQIPSPTARFGSAPTMGCMALSRGCTTF